MSVCDEIRIPEERMAIKEQGLVELYSAQENEKRILF